MRAALALFGMPYLSVKTSFRKRGLFIGSGVIEAGCQSVVAQRLKRSGLFWTLRVAKAIVALRRTRLSATSKTPGKASPGRLIGTIMLATCFAPALDKLSEHMLASVD